MLDNDGNYIDKIPTESKISYGSVFTVLGGFFIMYFIGSKVKNAVDKINNESDMQ